MKFSAKQITSLIDGETVGSEDKEISGFSGIDEAGTDDLSFIDGEKYFEFLSSSNAGIIIIPSTLPEDLKLKSDVTYIKCDHPRMALAKLMTYYKDITEQKLGISDHSFIDASASIGDSCYVGNFVSISSGVSIGSKCKIHEQAFIGENVTIGDNCYIHSGARILKDTVIGHNCTIQPNVIIGGDGFGFVPNQENNYFKVPHIGNVIIEDHVEIGANTCIDRATMGSTIIRKGVKLDNLIQIAHNVEIGENTVIAAQTGIAGSAKIGKNCLIGGQVGIVGHITIADSVKIAAQSGIGHSIKEEGAVMQGSPAFKIRDYKMSYVGFKKLPEMMKQISSLEKQIIELTEKVTH